MGDPRWVKFRDWSGVGIRGDNRYTCPSPPTPADVVVAASTRPEGGAYDTVVSYDGTAVTWGLAQWTFTGGRLQHLLAWIYNQLGSEAPVLKPLQALLTKMGLTMDPAARELKDVQGREISSKDDLRNLFTPVSGVVPKTGPRWELAKSIALVFHQLGKDPVIAKIQIEFFLSELHQEEILPRPKLDTRAICYYLGRVTDSDMADKVAARALTWAMWQNAPRAAEEHLQRALGVAPYVGPDSLRRLSGVFARSRYGFWGNAKAAETDRESRYHKVATTINEVLNQKLLDPDLR